ncbi:hypothetical protein VF14_31835 [Nostoc linckia z18]|uniref:Uncharacterized protein n=2 Tax=Nostoc linckia TaxID=92942 RepID=A0A9Q6EI58_NOSLI|nr:hypothetical protein [Nostoc linckia]PHK34616.1 hypothetical protein VF12_23585 [Nostoc linckia z15]PHK41179.1 hypothetical protein VF13_31690 [Nostoc linckia z16]PHJ55787.1 hypothetical protein VF02_35450 [Nostoc linckia z1]PHJ57001.1 hypothetical protein VF05_36470 [Nostoc linckia z3]PHJ58295.1 hypothetical protein VF03_35655 [Nostoc linckia z2]
MKTNFLYWVCVGLQGFQLLGFLTQINKSLIGTSTPLTLIVIVCIAISGYLDYSKEINNQNKVNFFTLLAMHISLLISILLAIALGGYLGTK